MRLGVSGLGLGFPGATCWGPDPTYRGCEDPQPSFPSPPLALLGWEGLSSMLSSETLDPGSRTLACLVDYAFGKKSMKKNASTDRSEAAWLPSDSQGVTSHPWDDFLLRSPSVGFLWALWAHPFWGPAPWPPGPIIFSGFRAIRRNVPALRLAWFLATWSPAWVSLEIASVVWLHIGLLLVCSVIMTLQTQLRTRSQESRF